MARTRVFVLGAAVLAAVAIAAWLHGPSGGTHPPRDVAMGTRNAAGQRDSEAKTGPAPEAPAAAVAPQSRDLPAAPDDGGDELGGEAIAAAWANVDLDEVRRAMPDNMYWRMGAPTADETEIERREQERDRWNVEYGKVLSGTGSEAEIRAYYDQRARLSGDYVEFATYLLDHYGDVLPERDVALLKLSRQLHLARLEEIPRSMQRALERKAEQDAARERWLAEERAFNGNGQ